jgi:hypothetical protein
VLGSVDVSRGEKHFCEEKKFALNPVFQIVVKLWFVFVCVCVFFPLCAFLLKFLQGSRVHQSLGRENRQTSTEKSFKVSLREREKWFCGFTILVGVFEDRRVEEASKAQRERERERERGSATSFVFGGWVKRLKGDGESAGECGHSGDGCVFSCILCQTRGVRGTRRSKQRQVHNRVRSRSTGVLHRLGGRDIHELNSGAVVAGEIWHPA